MIKIEIIYKIDLDCSNELQRIKDIQLLGKEEKQGASSVSLYVS